MPPTISLSLFPPSHHVLFIDSNCRGGDRGRNVKKQNRPWGQSSTTLLPEERKHSPPLFSLFHSLFLSFTLTAAPFPQSSSAPLWAAFKDSKCEDSNSVRVIAADRNLPYSHSVQSTLFIDQLHVFCVVLRNLCPLYWKMLNFQPQHWLLCKKKKNNWKKCVQREWQDASDWFTRKTRVTRRRVVTNFVRIVSSFPFLSPHI